MKENKNALTLVELMVATTISAIVLFFVGGFIATSLQEITESNKEADFMVGFGEFKILFNDYNGILGEQKILIDKNNDGNDIIMLFNEDKTLGVIFGVVDKSTMKLENNSYHYGIYYEKVLGYRELSNSEILTLESDPSLVYNYTFYNDKLFHTLYMIDFQASLYNNDTIFDINFVLTPVYQKSLDNRPLSDFDRGEFKEFNLNF